MRKCFVVRISGGTGPVVGESEQRIMTLLLLLASSALMKTLLTQIAKVLTMKMTRMLVDACFGLELDRKEKRQVVVLMTVLVFVAHIIKVSDL